MTFWTDERVEELRRLAPDHTASQIAQIMGAPTRNVIIGKMNRLGMSRPRDLMTPKRAAEAAATAKAAATVVKIRTNGLRMTPWASRPAFSGTSPISTIGGLYQCTLVQLTDETCRFPMWGDDTPAHERRYCGGKAVEGLPYCARCCGIAYRGKEQDTLPVRPSVRMEAAE